MKYFRKKKCEKNVNYEYTSIKNLNVKYIVILVIFFKELFLEKRKKKTKKPKYMH